MANSSYIVATEFLRPENSHEPVVYDATKEIEDKLHKMQELGFSICCDVYHAGNCIVYIYDAMHDVRLTPLASGMHSVADRMASKLIREFDLAKYS